MRSFESVRKAMHPHVQDLNHALRIFLDFRGLVRGCIDASDSARVGSYFNVFSLFQNSHNDLAEYLEFCIC